MWDQPSILSSTGKQVLHSEVRNSLCTVDEACQGSHPKQGYLWPNKRTNVLEKL